MTEADEVRVACLGAGYFAQFHHDAWSRIKDAKLVGVGDRDLQRAKATGVAAFSDIQSMLDETRPDLLDIVTPPPSHAQAIRAAIKAKVPTIICQKPFCVSYAQALEMTELAESAGATLVIHENFRFQPWYRAIKDIMDQGMLGEICQVTFRLRTGDGQGPKAYLDRQPYFQEMPRFLMHETGVHWIDTFIFLLGQPSAVYADIRKINPAIKGEDAGYFILDFPGGKRALFDANRLLDHAADNCRTTLGEAIVEGTAGTASLDGDGRVWFRAFKSATAKLHLDRADWAGFAGDCVAALNRHVIAAIRHGCTLENTAREYLKVIEIENAIYRAAETGQKVRQIHVD